MAKHTQLKDLSGPGVNYCSEYMTSLNESPYSNIITEFETEYKQQIKDTTKHSITILKRILCITLLFCIFEFITGIVIHSLAILTDAFHLSTDIINFILLIVSITLTNRSNSDIKFSYGYVRAEVIGSLFSMITIYLLALYILFLCIYRFILIMYCAQWSPLLPFLVNPNAVASTHSAGIVNYNHLNAYSNRHFNAYKYPPLVFRGDIDNYGPPNRNRTEISIKNSPFDLLYDSLLQRVRFEQGHTPLYSVPVKYLNTTLHNVTLRHVHEIIVVPKQLIDINTCDKIDALYMIVIGICGFMCNIIISLIIHINNIEEPKPMNLNKLTDNLEFEQSNYDVSIPKVTENTIDTAENGTTGPDMHPGGTSNGTFQNSSNNLIIQSALIHALGDCIQSIGIIIASIIIYLGNRKTLVYKSTAQNNLHSVLYQKTNLYNLADPLVSFLFSIIIMMSTRKIFKRILNILLEKAPDKIDIKQLHSKLLNIKGVLFIHDFHVWTLNNNQVSLSAHLVIRNNLTLLNADMNPDGSPTECSAEKNVYDWILKKAQIVCYQHQISHHTIQIDTENFICPGHNH